MLSPSINLSFRLIAAIIFLFAVPSFVLGGWSYFNTKDFISNAVSTRGEVIQLIEVSGTEGASTYAPRVKFLDTNGNTIEATSSSSSSPPRHQVGDNIEILYDPKVPQKFRTTDWFSLWGLTTIGLSIGSFTFLLSLIVAFLGPIIFKGLFTKGENKQE